MLLSKAPAATAPPTATAGKLQLMPRRPASSGEGLDGADTVMEVPLLSLVRESVCAIETKIIWSMYVYIYIHIYIYISIHSFIVL